MMKYFILWHTLALVIVQWQNLRPSAKTWVTKMNKREPNPRKDTNEEQRFYCIPTHI